jgi:CHAT domain-containing protein
VKKDEPQKQIARLHKKALQLYENGQYDDALSIVIQICKQAKRTFGENHSEYAYYLSNLAELYYYLGDYSKAEPLYQEVVEIRRKVLGKDHPDYARSLSNLAYLYNVMGIDYRKAKSLYQEALKIQGKVPGKDHPDYAHSLSNLAFLYSDMGDYSKAEPLYQEALKIQGKVPGKDHQDYAHSLSNLALLYYYVGEYRKAKPLYQEALKIQGKVLGKDHPDYAANLSNLALLHSDMGYYSKAEPLYLQALEIYRKVLGENHPDYAANLSNLALLYIAIGRRAEGMKLMKKTNTVYDQMIGQIFSIGSEIERMGFLRSIEWNLHMFLSFVLKYFRSSSEAINSALDLVLLRKAIGAEALAAQRDAVLSGKYPELEPKLTKLKKLRMQISRKTLDGPNDRESLAAHQQYLEKLNTQKERIEKYLAHSVQEIRLEQKLRTANRHAISNRLFRDDVLIEFIRFNIVDFLAVPVHGQRMVKPAHYIAFILLGNEPDNVQMIDLGEAKPVDKMINSLRASITGEVENREIDNSVKASSARNLVHLSPKSIKSAESKDDVHDLRKAIIKPLITALQGRKRLFIAADGDLNRLPFEILPAADGKKHLIDEYFISYLSTGRDILRFVDLTNSLSIDPLVAADPDFDFGITNSSSHSNNSGSGSIVVPTAYKTDISQSRHSRELSQNTIHFGQLQGTRIEGKKIANMLHVKPWLGGRVLEAPLKSCRSPRILHIATHGFFLPDQSPDPPNKGNLGAISSVGSMMLTKRLSAKGLENPLLRSGLALAGANRWLQHGLLPREAEDGILTAEDVSAIDLSTTELVVLSACETGLGEIQIGEGVFGLRRAFVLAGAQTLVMSLWKVPDEQTKDLMVDFYKRLLDSKPRAEALREAQLAMKEKYPNPYYWGAFICQGNPGPLSVKT